MVRTVPHVVPPALVLRRFGTVTTLDLAEYDTTAGRGVPN